jgi:hypothetical protein
MRFRAQDLRPHGRRPSQTLQIPDWCGCSTEYLPVPGDGWWQLVPIWDPAQTPNPLGAPGVAVERGSLATGSMTELTVLVGGLVLISLRPARRQRSRRAILS